MRAGRIGLMLLALAGAGVGAGGVRGQDVWDGWNNPYAGQPKSLSLEAFGGPRTTSPNRPCM